MKKHRKAIDRPHQPSPERLQKVMASAGLGSRRSLESLIREGAVQVDGRNAQLGESVKPGDRVRFRDQEYRVAARNVTHRTLIYNKPEGEVTTRSDPQGRATVFDRLPPVAGARWVAVGRLDINTTGLLLLTTDGELANAMMHPSSRVDREYVCRIRGSVSDEQIDQLRQGVQLEDGPARFSDIRRLPGSSGNQWFQVTILEGRNREVRRLWQAIGCMVSRLKRVRYGAARLPKGLRMGRWSEITPSEHSMLRQDVNLPAQTGQITLQAAKARDRTRQRNKSKPATKPAKQHRVARPGAKPGSPAGTGRRPHPRNRKAQR